MVIDSMKNSVFGTLSLIAGFLSLVLILGTSRAVAYLFSMAIVESEPWQTLAFLYVPVVTLLAFLGFGLGIIGLYRKSSKRGGALSGLMFCGITILISIGIVVFVYGILQRV